jgi:hypothetical protein
MNVKSENLRWGESKLMNTTQDSSLSIAREKIAFGAAYGAAAGIIYAIALWAWDAAQLSQAHAFFPWVKLLLGMLLCGLTGAIAGWLVARKENSLFSFFTWLAAAALMAWITVGVPLQIFPIVAKWLNPELGQFLNYTIGDAYAIRFWLAMLWIGIFLSLTGMLEMTLVESAVFSPAGFSKIVPFLVCAVLMGIAGFVIDDLVNVPLRKAVLSVETPIQFVLDHRGQHVEPAESRKYHAGSLHGVVDAISASHSLIVSGYDDGFWQIHVLVKFETAWADCISVNSQSAYCKFVEPNP